MNKKEIHRCGSIKKDIFYSIPKSGERYDFFEPEKLKLCNQVELTGKLTKKVSSPYINNVLANSFQKEENFKTSKKIKKQNDSQIFNFQTSKSQKSLKSKGIINNYSNTRIGYLAYKEPIKSYKTSYSNTFKSSGLNCNENINEKQDEKYQLKRCENSKHSYNSQIKNLPGGTYRKDNEIKDDFPIKRSKSSDYKKVNNSIPSDCIKIKSIINLKNYESGKFENKYSQYLNERDVVSNNHNAFLGKGEYLNSNLNNNNYSTISGWMRKKINKEYRSEGISELLKPKILKKDYQEKTLTGKTIKNIMHQKFNNSPKNKNDNIYNPYQSISHKKTSFGNLINRQSLLSSHKNLIC